jgi:mxaL protein
MDQDGAVGTDSSWRRLGRKVKRHFGRGLSPLRLWLLRAWPLLLTALLLLATFTHPTWPGQRQLVEQVVVLDITESMNTLDMHDGPTPISRLSHAKQSLARTLPQLPCGSRLGWAVFTEHRSYLLTLPVEVCAHRKELLRSLAYIDRRMAWSGNSEVAKGLHSGLRFAQSMPTKPALVFVTDGHEAPPLDARYRPGHDLKTAELQGLVIGVGGNALQAIPKTDPDGRPIGRWRADDVLQTSPRSQARADQVDDAPAAPPEVNSALGNTPGSEHLSNLREPYLRLLAAELGLAYHRLGSVAELLQALQAPSQTRPVTVQRDGRVALAAAALALLLWPHLAALLRRASPRPAKPGGV